MWALCMGSSGPSASRRVIGFGIPAVALPGMRGNAFFRAMTTPGVRALVSRVPAPKDANATRRAMADAIGRPALRQLSDAYLDVLRATMLISGWRLAMTSHLNLAMRWGRPRPEKVLTDDELRGIPVPVRLVLGDHDVYGGPEIGRRAVGLMPDAQLDAGAGSPHRPGRPAPARGPRAVASALPRSEARGGPLWRPS